MSARHVRGWRVVAILGAWIALSTCSKAGRPAEQPLRLHGRDGALIAQLTKDGVYVDGAGKRIGAFDAAKSTMTVNGLTIDLKQVVHSGQHGAFELHLPIGTWYVQIAGTGDLEIDGKPFGKIDGYDEGAAGQLRVAAFVAGVPLLAPAARTEPAPAAADESHAAPPEPPPPPPPPPLHHGG